MASRLFPFLEKKHSKIRKRAAKHFEGLAALSPIQRDGGRRSRPGVNPFISALTVTRCPATFPGVWPQLRDTLSTSRSVGRGTGAFIYAQSAVETRPVLTALRHASTALLDVYKRQAVLRSLSLALSSRFRSLSPSCCASTDQYCRREGHRRKAHHSGYTAWNTGAILARTCYNGSGHRDFCSGCSYHRPATSRSPDVYKRQAIS